MKSQAAVTEAILTIGMMLLMAVAFWLLPNLIKDTIKMLALASAEVVARDLAGFISVSGAAPGNIEIVYNPPKKFSYDVWISNRIVYVRRLGKTSEIGTAKTWLDIQVPTLENVNSFVITKTKDDVYSLMGRVQ